MAWYPSCKWCGKEMRGTRYRNDWCSQKCYNEMHRETSSSSGRSSGCSSSSSSDIELPEGVTNVVGCGCLIILVLFVLSIFGITPASCLSENAKTGDGTNVVEVVSSNQVEGATVETTTKPFEQKEKSSTEESAVTEKEGDAKEKGWFGKTIDVLVWIWNLLVKIVGWIWKAILWIVSLFK